MILLDVNVLVYSHRHDAREHARYRNWLEMALDSGDPVGISDLALSGLVRIVTNPRIYPDSTPIENALAFARQLREHDGCRLVVPGARHWELFENLCRTAGAKGPLVTDAYFAALAIESRSEWITTDRDYARFPGLRWRHPFA